MAIWQGFRAGEHFVSLWIWNRKRRQIQERSRLTEAELGGGILGGRSEIAVREDRPVGAGMCFPPKDWSAQGVEYSVLC